MMIIVSYVSGFFLSWYLISGMFWSQEQTLFPSVRSKSGREELGVALTIGMFYGVIWPVCLPIAFLMTGFAEHGVWRDPLKPKREPSDTVAKELERLHRK